MTESTLQPNTIRGNIGEFSSKAPPLRSTAAAIFRAALVPAILYFLVWQLSPAYEAATLKGSLVRSLGFAIPILYFALLLEQILKVGGAAEKHFGWSPIFCDGLLKTVGKLALLYVPLTVFATALETFAEGVYYDSLGRFCFMASMVVLSVGLWETGKSIGRWREADSDCPDWQCAGWRWTIHLLACAPAVLALMAAAGFHFTAVQLSWRLVVTILMTLGVSALAGLVSRLLLVTQFRIKLRQLDRDEDGEIVNDETIDISEISEQVNRLLRVTALVAMVMLAWQVWGSVVPAVGYLDEVHLWHSSIAGAGEVSWITLRHLLMAIAIMSITWVLSRNLPGLLEITLLDRLPLDKGGRYAISFVMRYVVGVVGTLFALQIIGFSWKSVQLLAAGLTVGLGFGLQEIFANLVSGIIILIERPIRVGDLVTVNGVTGTVTQLQLRATTIKDLDHRELIVPNKKFITDDVMNWTLTDRLSRLVFPIGIAYGSDTKLAERTLLKVAREHPLVMNDPEPNVLFKSFGNSTLDFELRVVIPTRERFVEVQHELNMAIDDAFREQGIEIAFPQQDVNVKGVELVHTPQPTPDPPKKQTTKKANQTVASISVSKLGPEDFSGVAFAKAVNGKETSGKGSPGSVIPEVTFAKRAA